MLFETLRLVCCAFSFQCGACEADDRLGLPAKEPQSLWEARLCATLALRLVCCALSFQCGACEADDRLGLPAKEPQSLWEARLCATLALRLVCCAFPSNAAPAKQMIGLDYRPKNRRVSGKRDSALPLLLQQGDGAQSPEKRRGPQRRRSALRVLDPMAALRHE